MKKDCARLLSTFDSQSRHGFVRVVHESRNSAPVC